MPTMITDLYTKIVLTVIAAALVWLSIQPVVGPRLVSAQSQSHPQKVVIVGTDGQEMLLVPSPKGPSLPVTVANK